MKIKTEKHGEVDAVFHVWINSTSKLKCGNHEFYIGAFSTYDKAFEAAEVSIQERVPDSHWGMGYDLKTQQGIWMPVVSAIATFHRNYKVEFTLKIAASLVDNRRRWSSSGMGFIWLHPGDNHHEWLSQLESEDIPAKKSWWRKLLGR